MFEPLCDMAAALGDERDWPSLETMQALVSSRAIVTAGGAPLRLVAQSGGAYEARIRLAGEMHVRAREWHDLFNVLAWLTYPRTKAALNDAQYAAWREENGGADGVSAARRGRRRDALTLLDESGMLVLATDPSLLDDLRSFRWKRLFRERRQQVLTSMRFLVFGHALFEKALRPYVGLTAHALLLTVARDVLSAPLAATLASADCLASRAIASIDTPRALSPVPVLGVPGWWHDNEQAAFYDNADYFRSGRRKD